MCSSSYNVVKLFANRETEKDYQIFMEYCDRSNYLADKILEVRGQKGPFPLNNLLFVENQSS
jgi:hypothetical protein